MNIEQRYNEWLENVTDEQISAQLKEMQFDNVKKTNAFFKDLEFGTGGLRGEIGAGTNCLNIYTIAKVTQGIADCMKAKGQSVAAVSFDSRINSDIFAKCAAQVFASNGIKAYITRELMPTPFLSFLTRTVKADIGVMITASHNPAKYNGYKVYGSDGCQLTDAAATEMIGYINKIDPFKVALCDYDEAVNAGKIIVADDKIEVDYLSEVQKQSLNRADGVSITYTPLNGTGYRLIPEILRRSGVETIHIPEPQAYPDGNFTTCPYPNPEKKEALKLGLELAEKTKTDILIATDPDADRIGIAVLHNGKYELLTGNEVGVLLTDYLFSVKKARNTLPDKPVIVKTIVTTPLALKIAAEYDAVSYDVLTGFKYIGDVIGKLEKTGEEYRFILGYEESYGYLSGTYVRDKDAVVAAMLIAEMTAHFKHIGKTLVTRLNEIYNKYGKYEHRLISFEYPGAEGNAKMKTLLSDFRRSLPEKIAGKTVAKTIDYLTQTEFDLPQADVVSLTANDGTQLIVRPSGTEPLIKLYLTACATEEDNIKTFEALTKQLHEIFK